MEDLTVAPPFPRPQMSAGAFELILPPEKRVRT